MNNTSQKGYKIHKLPGAGDPGNPLPLSRPRGQFLKALLAIVWKDLVVEMRGRELISVMLVFSLLAIVVFNFALELDPKMRVTVSSGVLWVTFAFAGTLGLNRSMAIEKDRGCLDGLLLAPIDHSAIFIGKALGNLIFMLVVETIILPIYSVLYNVNLFQPGLIAVILLGSLGYVVVGTLLSSMAVQTRTRDVLLPILLFPIVIPLLIAAVKASSAFLLGNTLPQAVLMQEIWPWLNLMIVFDLIFIAVSFMVFDYIIEE